MLGLKNVLAQADEVPSLIFDEIDQGIGGRVGMTVGQKLWNLSRSHQVFCVTHLPQLAVFGEVGLSGEIRPVPNGQERLKEAIKHGFKHIIVPRGNAPQKTIAGVQIIAVARLHEALTEAMNLAE